MHGKFASQLGHSAAVLEAVVVLHCWRSVLMQMEQYFVVKYSEKVHQHFHFMTRYNTEW